MHRQTKQRTITSPAGALLLGTALAVGASMLVSRAAHAQDQGYGSARTQTAAARYDATSQQIVTYGLPHVEGALSEALTPYVTVGELRLELDNRSIELRAPADWGSPTVQNIYHSDVNGRFAAELVVQGPNRSIRYPVSGRVYGVSRVPVLNRRVAPGDAILPGDVDWSEVRADLVGSDIVSAEIQLVGMTPARGIGVRSPIRLRDVQTPRVVDKGATVTITLISDRMSLTAQGRSMEDGGVGDVIRVMNTQSNRIVQATVSGANTVAVAIARTGGALN